jgi:hypothetical protein
VRPHHPCLSNAVIDIGRHVSQCICMCWYCLLLRVLVGSLFDPRKPTEDVLKTLLYARGADFQS